MPFIADMLTRRNKIGTELAAVDSSATNDYVLRLHEELRRIQDILESPIAATFLANDFDPIEKETRGVT